MSFRFKTANFWLPQFSSRGFPRLASSELDDALIEDYRRYLPRAKEAGFDNLLIFGLIGEGGANQLPADLDTGFTAQHDRRIRKVIELIHQNDLKVLAGFGVLSYGYTHIIAAHPEVAATAYDFRGLGSGWRGDHVMHNNAGLQDVYDRLQGEVVSGPPAAPAWGISVNDVMCASSDEAWRWHDRALRFILDRYDVDGFEVQGANNGRCLCPRCRPIENITYSAQMTARSTALIRRLAPGALVAVSDGGLRPDGARDNETLKLMGKGADYLVDCFNSHQHSLHFMNGPNKAVLNDRPDAVRALAPLAFGAFCHVRDTGLERDTWFLPAARSLVQVIGDAYRDGCQAMVYCALGAWNNPGHELNNYVTGYAMSNPDHHWRVALEAVVDRLYRPQSPAARRGLADLFAAAELSCLHNDVLLNMRHALGGPELPYLVGTNAFKQLRYQRELEDFGRQAQHLAAELNDGERTHRLVRTLETTAAVVGQPAERYLAAG